MRQTTWYLYDNEDIAGEYDNDGALLRSYIHGQGIDEPIRMTNHSTSANYYYLADCLGSIIQIQDVSRSTVESYTYDSFGNSTIKDATGTVISQSAIHNPYMFTAREWDNETQFYYYRARYCDAGVGRFLSEDPIGFVGGVNFYNYVGNDPISRNDPLGYFSIKIPKIIKDWEEYGNWCGAGRGSGSITDAMDACCRLHDRCYDRRVKSKCPKRTIPKEKNCDNALLDCLSKLPADPRQWKPPATDPYRAESYRRLADKYFKEKWKENDKKEECECK